MTSIIDSICGNEKSAARKELGKTNCKNGKLFNSLKSISILQLMNS